MRHLINTCKAIGKVIRQRRRQTNFLQLALAVVLSICGSGCCTSYLLDSAKYTARNTLNPSAVYQTTNFDELALGGTQFKDTIEYNQVNAGHIFVVMPKEELVPINLRTNNMLSMSDIKTLQPNRTRGLKIKAQLPPTFKKTADLPPNKASLVLKERHPRRICYVFVPVTAAVDVATAPIQILGVGLFLLMWSSGPHC